MSAMSRETLKYAQILNACHPGLGYGAPQKLDEVVWVRRAQHRLRSTHAQCGCGRSNKI